MANTIKKILFENKEPYKLLPDIDIKQKVTSANINEIKDVINNNADYLTKLTNDDIAINERIDLTNSALDAVVIKVDRNTADILKLLQTPVFNYKGPYDASLTYNIGDIVSDQDKEYLSLIDNNTDPLTITNAWLLLGFEIDLSNYYNKDQIDLKLAPIDNSIRDLNTTIATKANQSDLNVVDNTVTVLETDMNQAKDDIATILIDTQRLEDVKQEKLIAGANITIDETTNTISASGGGTGDVTKAYVDQQDNLLSDRIDTNKTLVDTNTRDISTIDNTLTTIETDLNTINADIPQMKTAIQTNLDAIDGLDGSTVKLTGNQTIAGDKTFSNVIKTSRSGQVMYIDCTSQAAHIDINDGGTTNIMTMGRTSNSNWDGQIRSKHNLRISSAKTSAGDGVIITEVVTPTGNDWAANKEYVDNAINPVSTKATTNETNITTLTAKVNKTTPTADNDLSTKKYVDDATDTLETQIDTLETKANLITENDGNYTLDVGTGKTITIDKLATPTTDNQAATKKYVDDNSGTSYTAGTAININSSNVISVTDTITTGQIYQINPPYEMRIYSQHSDVKIKPGTNKSINCMGFPIVNIAETPRNNTDATSKKYVDDNTKEKLIGIYDCNLQSNDGSTQTQKMSDILGADLWNEIKTNKEYFMKITVYEKSGNVGFNIPVFIYYNYVNSTETYPWYGGNSTKVCKSDWTTISLEPHVLIDTAGNIKFRCWFSNAWNNRMYIKSINLYRRVE